MKIPGDALLRLSDVTLHLGGVRALNGVGMTVRQGAVHAVIGPNGAGKSSLLNCVSGLYRPQSGTVTLHRPGGAVSLVGRRPDRIARHGVARTFQNLELFRELSVLENLMLGRHVHMRRGILPSLLGFAREAVHRPVVGEIVDLLGLAAVRHRPVGTLAYGVQKRVELGRALCQEPVLLLLDEPAAGLTAGEKAEIAKHLRAANAARGVTVVLIEHDVGFVTDLSHHVTVLDLGEVIADGTPDAVRTDPRVVAAYLGAAP